MVNAQKRPPAQPFPPSVVTGAGCLARLLWMGVGSLLLAVFAVSITSQTGQFLSLADGLFWATVAGMIVIRFWDIRRLHGLTATGAPASMSHWRRYVVLLLLVSAAMWAAAHAMAHFSA